MIFKNLLFGNRNRGFGNVFLKIYLWFRQIKKYIKHCYFLFLFGGPSQLETFDLKPTAPSTLRGPFKPIASRTPGLLISEHLSRCAQISDKFAVIRSMTHPYNDHGAAHYI